MPTPGLYTTADALPKATLRARERGDRSWMTEGRCRGHDGHMRHAWLVDWERKVTEIDGVWVRTSSLIDAALTICHTCPVQYDCVAWAVYVDERGGTWGLNHEDMEYLKRRPDWEDFIARAQRKAQPIQVAVRRARKV